MRRFVTDLLKPMSRYLFILLSCLCFLPACSQSDTGKIPITLMTFEWAVGKDNYRARERLFNSQSKDIHLTIMYTGFATYITKLLASFSGNMSPDLFYSMTGRDRLF